ncbi:MAG: GNAT family N-acetyltransferase [Lachnospiraceae bacterium]|nr:GNAT family N-acetyltransferase [Lachnospiraceae bacterium]
MILETDRLFLREMSMNDYDALYSVLADPAIMQHYPYKFDETRVCGWIEKNIGRYEKDGFGLWAVCLKDTGEMIGDCGLTLQDIDGKVLPEIGYHISGKYQNMGYASEAAAAVRDWAFSNTEFAALYSYCRSTNTPSIKTAQAIGMSYDREYNDEDGALVRVSKISRTEAGRLTAYEDRR